MEIEMSKKVHREYKINPTLADLGYLMYEVERKVRTISRNVRREDGGKVSIIKQVKYEKVVEDTGKYVKIYTDSDFMMKFLTLTISAQKVMHYLFSNLLRDSLGIWLHPSIIATEKNMGDEVVVRALHELVEADMLMHSTIHKRFYWINIHYYFNGFRDKLYEQSKATFDEFEIAVIDKNKLI